MGVFLDTLAASRRFGMRPGLDRIRGICAALGDPQKRLCAVHVAGTNGKGAVCAILDACLRAGGLSVGRYTSPHLVRLNERFFLGGEPVSDELLESAASRVAAAVKQSRQSGNQTTPNLSDLTFFEALTAVAFLVYAEAGCDFAVLETGLGGRLDATNVCEPEVCVITKIGLDHCDWLGDTVEKIAAEKAGIIKPGVPVVLGRNDPAVVAVVKARAREVGAPFFYAPDRADEREIPEGFSLGGAFNRENAVTALAALKVLGQLGSSKGLIGSALRDTTPPQNAPAQPIDASTLTLKDSKSTLNATQATLKDSKATLSDSKATLKDSKATLKDSNATLKDSKSTLNDAKATLHDTMLKGFCTVVWPGRFQRVGPFIVDGAHNPPAARALVSALAELGLPPRSLDLVAGFCGDKDVVETLRTLAPFVRRGIAVRTNNPRSLGAEETAAKMRAAGIDAVACPSLEEAIRLSGERSRPFPVPRSPFPSCLVCGSLFLAGEALAALGAFPWAADRFDAAEILRV